MRSAAAGLAASTAATARTAPAAAGGMGEHPDLSRLAGRERHEDVGGDASLAAPSGPSAVAAAAAISTATWGNDALQGPLARYAVAAVAAAPAVAAGPPVAAPSGRGQDGQRADKLADGYLGELARASGASLGAVAARGGLAAVPSVGGTRCDRAQQPGAEPCLRRRCPGAPGAVGAVTARRSAGAVQRPGAVVDGERGGQDRELVLTRLAWLADQPLDDEDQQVAPGQHGRAWLQAQGADIDDVHDVVAVV